MKTKETETKKCCKNCKYEDASVYGRYCTISHELKGRIELENCCEKWEKKPEK